MIRARWIIAGVFVTAAVAVLVTWRLDAQTVNVVVVNSSRQPATLSFQPALFTDEVTSTIGGCSSSSIELRAGATWQLTADTFEIGSGSVEVPLLAREVAFEVWLNPDGSNRIVTAHPVERPVGAPYPPDCASPLP